MKLDRSTISAAAALAVVLQVYLVLKLDAKVATLPSDHTPRASFSETFSLAFKQSYGFFTDISNDEWAYRSNLCHNRIDHKYLKPKRYLEPSHWYFHNYYPAFSCPQIWRVGDIGDGGKWTCNLNRLPDLSRKRIEKQGTSGRCLIYAVGSHGKFEWEDGVVQMINTSCEIHIFDPQITPHEAPAPDNMYLHKWGFTSSYSQNYTPYPKGEFLSLHETVNRLGHEDRTIDILKIDCEGCEWYCWKDWLQHDIRQILLETHDVVNNTSLELFDGLYDAGFVIFSREVNTHPKALIRPGMGVEWGFIRLDPAFCGGAKPRLTATSLGS